MAVTSMSAVVLRVIVLAVLAALLSKFQGESEDYHQCRDNGNTQLYCADRYLSTKNIEAQRILNSGITFALVLTVLYLILSVAGTVCGFVGGAAEEAYARQNPVSRSGAPAAGAPGGTMVVTIPNQSTYGQATPVMVVQAQAVPYQPAQVQMVQPQAQPESGYSHSSYSTDKSRDV
jgi:hypothetical protein